VANFPTIVGFPALSINDQVGSPSTLRMYVPGIGTTPYWDPPDNPVPLSRAPAGEIAPSDGSRSGQRLAVFSLSPVSTASSAWGTGADGIALTREVNRRALANPETNRQSEIEAENPGGLGLAVGQEWFEKCHVIPGSLALGNVLSSQVRTIELFNSFRRPIEIITWTAFVNNVGAGVDVTNLPILPFIIPGFGSFIAFVQISTTGPPSISGTLDFTLSAPTAAIIAVPVTGNRITIFQYKPQSPIRERLLFKTDIIRLFDGKEQRIRLREAPRQALDFNIRTDDDRTRDSINSVLFDWQARVFGVPIWFELKPLGAPIVIGATLIVVDTADADYRDGSLVMVYDSDFNFEVLEIDSFTAGDITTKTPFFNAFDAVATEVMPVRTAFTAPQLNNTRFSIGPTDFKIPFETLDNVDLADIGPFTTFQGIGQTVAKPVLDDFNFMSGATISEGIRRKVIKLDAETGPPTQFSPWAKGKPLFQFAFEAKDQATVYDWRRLAHFLHGNQLSFYIPTGRRDLKPLVDLGDGGAVIVIENIGFTDFIGSVTPRSDLLIVRTDGTQSLHTISGSNVIDADEERVTIAPGVTPALPVSEVDRMSILTLSRIINDKVAFDHERPGTARISLQSMGVPS